MLLHVRLADFTLHSIAQTSKPGALVVGCHNAQRIEQR
jgi:hypothetical protein